MQDPIGAAAAFHDACGIEPLDVRERGAAVSTVTRLADVCGQGADDLVQVMCALLGDLEAGASDEVLLMGFEHTGLRIAKLLLDLYNIAHLLGIGAVEQLVEREYASRMSALRGEGYCPLHASGLVALPGA